MSVDVYVSSDAMDIHVGLGGPGGPRGPSAKEVLIAAGVLPEGATDETFADWLRDPAIVAALEAIEAANRANISSDGAVLATQGATEAAQEARAAAAAAARLVAEEESIRAAVLILAERSEAASVDAVAARDRAVEAESATNLDRGAAIDARDAAVDARQASEAARDVSIANAQTVDLLLMLMQRGQAIYGINDIGQASAFARSGVELLFTSNYYRVGLVIK